MCINLMDGWMDGWMGLWVWYMVDLADMSGWKQRSSDLTSPLPPPLFLHSLINTIPLPSPICLHHISLISLNPIPPTPV